MKIEMASLSVVDDRCGPSFSCQICLRDVLVGFEQQVLATDHRCSLMAGLCVLVHRRFSPLLQNRISTEKKSHWAEVICPDTDAQVLAESLSTRSEMRVRRIRLLQLIFKMFDSKHTVVLGRYRANVNLPFSEGVPADLRLLKLAVASCTRCESGEAI